MSNQKFSLTIFLIFSAIIIHYSLFIIPASAEVPWAKQEARLFIDEATILKGYTVIVGNNDFKLGVRDKAISQAATAVIRELNEVHAPTGPVVNARGDQLDYKRVSSAWEFDFLSEPRIGVLNKPLYAAIKNPDLNSLLDACKKETIVTFRSKNEGGKNTITESEGVELLKKALELDADFVDLELSLGKNKINELMKKKEKQQNNPFTSQS